MMRKAYWCRVTKTFAIAWMTPARAVTFLAQSVDPINVGMSAGKTGNGYLIVLNLMVCLDQ